MDGDCGQRGSKSFQGVKEVGKDLRIRAVFEPESSDFDQSKWGRRPRLGMGEERDDASEQRLVNIARVDSKGL